MNDIILSGKQETALDFLENKKSVKQVLYGGSAGPGKTTLGCIWQIERRLDYPGTRGFIGRRTLKDLKDTTLMTFIELEQTFYSNEGITYDFQKNRINFPNGSLIYLGYTAYAPTDHKYTRIGGLEITDAFVDEASESPEDAINILSSRIRYKLINGMQKMLLCTNPTIGWMKNKWIKDLQGKPIILPEHQVYVPALIDDNPDKEFVKVYKAGLELLPLADRQRLLHGDWDYVQNDSPFITEFNEEKQVGDFIIDEAYPLWLTFDFNIDPCTCLLFQEKRDGVYFLKEVQVRGGTEKLCQELKLYMSHKNAIFVTGDRSGNSGSTSAGIDDRSLITDYTIIKKELRLNDFAFKHNKNANKQLEYSRRLVNYAFRNTNICFDRSMVQTIQDIKNAKVDENEKLVKDRQTYKLDCFDAMRYGINAIFPKGINDIDRKRIMHN